MALSPREFVEEVEKYFVIIEQKRKNLRNEKSYHIEQRVRLGSIDVSELKEEIIEITISLHRLFIAEQTINNLSAVDTEKILKRARLIALAGITESFKKYDNKQEDNFWQFYANDNDLSVNENFYKKIVEPVLMEENIIPYGLKGKINYTDYIARESELSKSSLSDIIYLFKFYFKYFYPTTQLKDFFKEINFSLTGYKSQLEFLDKESPLRVSVEDTYKRLSEFQGKSELLISNLVSFVDFINRSNRPLSEENIFEICSEFNTYYFEDLSYIFVDEELKADFIDNFSSIPEYKFISILESFEDEKTVVILPDNTKTTIDEYLYAEHFFGKHKINNIEYNVYPQCFNEDDLDTLEIEKINVCGRRAFIKSKNSFVAMLGNNDSHKKSAKVNIKGENFFIWFDNRPLYEVISVESDFSEIESLLPKENIISSLSLKLKNEDSAPSFDFHLEQLILVSESNKGKRLELINTDQVSIMKDFPIDDVCYTGEIVYPIKDKRPGKIDILLVADKEPIHLSEFESRVTCELEESILFDGNTGGVIKPSPYNIQYAPDRLFLFTVRRFDYKWINDSCEVYECKNFGRFHVYEILWLNKSKYLSINMDSDFRWTFLECINFKASQKFQAYRNNFVEYEINQIFALDDVNINLSSDIAEIEFKNVSVKTFVNSAQTSSNISMGFINKLLDRNENSANIDKSFIQRLIPETNLIYGRYDFEFFIKNSYLGKYTLFIIPNLQGEEYNSVYQENEEVIITIKSQTPCFRNNKNHQSYKFDDLSVCDFFINANKFIDTKKRLYTKKAKLFMPYTEVDIKYEPEVVALRFSQDGRIYQSDSIDYYNIDKVSLVIKSPHKDARLKVNNNVVKPLIANNFGIIMEPLKSIKTYLSKNDNTVSIQSGKHELFFSVIWDTKVSNIESEPFIDSREKQSIDLSISYEGVPNSVIKFIATDDNGNSLDIRKVSCEEDFAPKFVRIEKNQASIICDGKKWENRKFSIYLEQSNLDKTENIIIKGILENNNEVFAELFFKNIAANKELLALNNTIKNEEKNTYALFERGFIYSELGQYQLAEEDLKKVSEYGIDDKEANEYIDFFKNNISTILFENEVNKIGNLAQKFVLDELNR